jgi:hypothetical protein
MCLPAEVTGIVSIYINGCAKIITRTWKKSERRGRGEGETKTKNNQIKSTMRSSTIDAPYGNGATIASYGGT